MPLSKSLITIIVLSVLLCASLIVMIIFIVKYSSTDTASTDNPALNKSGDRCIEKYSGSEYYGLSLGPLSQLAHRVSGRVFLVDKKRIFIKDLTYDGTAPQAHFWIGVKGKANDYPDTSGEPTPDENGSLDRFTKPYRGEDVQLTLKSDITIHDIKWFSLWCIQFTMNFGHVLIPEKLDVPAPHKFDATLTDEQMKVRSGPITATDHRTVRIETFSYDGNETDLYFVAGKGSNPSVFDSVEKIPRATGGLAALSNNDLKDVEVILNFPKEFTLIDADFIALFSATRPSTYKMITLPHCLNVPPHL